MLQHGHNRQILKEIHIGETYFNVMFIKPPIHEHSLRLMNQSYFLYI
jgi:hypothetical protein